MPFTVLFEVMGPQPTNKKYGCSKQDVHDKSLQIHILKLREINFIDIDILKIAKQGMVNDHDQHQRKLQFPVLIGDK